MLKGRPNQVLGLVLFASSVVTGLQLWRPPISALAGQHCCRYSDGYNCEGGDCVEPPMGWKCKWEDGSCATEWGFCS